MQWKRDSRGLCRWVAQEGLEDSSELSLRALQALSPSLAPNHGFQTLVWG